jgi:hypothetical protein
MESGHVRQTILTTPAVWQQRQEQAATQRLLRFLAQSKFAVYISRMYASVKKID